MPSFAVAIHEEYGSEQKYTTIHVYLHKKVIDEQTI